MAPQDSTKYFVINTATQGELSELGELGDSVFNKRRTIDQSCCVRVARGYTRVLPVLYRLISHG